ncbi:unnamed protein product [Rotaria sordida]|uniref:Uncharacterized protein n=2 Tax=Rotaria sordida TaxID=392033 RepID=A0A819XAD4_9BILA|nr:unnamed protein product [Rotaria sordida]
MPEANFKILSYQLPDLQIDGLNTTIINCQTVDQLKTLLKKYRQSILIIVCCSNHLIEIDQLLINYKIDTLYVLNNQEDQDIREWLTGLIIGNIIEINNRKQLMRNLSTKIMLCYYNQGLQHRTSGDIGLANLCFIDSLNALNYSAQFI